MNLFDNALCCPMFLAPSLTLFRIANDLLTIWLQKLHTAVATPTHFNALKAINRSIFMRAQYQE